ncbi:hypothetical protein M5K25_008788 [Dendrobium thyrsiflorum]|uniref:Uncharacterized protein n=1 Tax=Dendrobium thyrsiflorum TaxID=117978 RepID=A0ABD0V9F4_DENTH
MLLDKIVTCIMTMPGSSYLKRMTWNQHGKKGSLSVTMTSYSKTYEAKFAACLAVTATYFPLIVFSIPIIVSFTITKCFSSLRESLTFARYCIADMSQYKKGKDDVDYEPIWTDQSYPVSAMCVTQNRWSDPEDCFSSCRLASDGEQKKKSFLGKRIFCEILIDFNMLEFALLGQFICGNRHCDEKDGLGSYEVNFSYVEAGENKQALVKLVACKRCAEKLVYNRNKEKEKLLKRDQEEITRKRYSVNCELL